jgi:acetyl-CoA C-acetyltransferase
MPRRQLGLTPLARVVSTPASALSPEIMGLGLIEATALELARAGQAIGDIDSVEVSKTFATQVIPTSWRIGIDKERLTCTAAPLPSATLRHDR